MGKKLVVLGLVLLLAGSGVFAWSLYARKGERQLLDVIKARLDKLENIDTDEVSIRMLADIFSTDDWKQRLDSYNTKRETRELLLDTSVVFILTSVAILTSWLLILLCQTFWRLIHQLRKPSLEPEKDRQKVVIIQPEMSEDQLTGKKTGKDKSEKKYVEHS